jgi:predicted O-linked N-acetylglucosamine transferase (SPINDLY family)
MNQDILNIARQHHQLGRLAEAISGYRQVLVVSPDHADTLHLLGYAIHQSGQPQEGLKWIQRAIELNPQQPVYQCNLAVVLSALGRHEESISASRQAVNLQEQFPEAWFNLANSCRTLRRFPESIEAYRKALSQRPNWPEAHSNFGVALAAADDSHAAVEEFQTALKQNPNIPIASFNLGNTFRDLGRFEEAINAYRRAVALDPNYVDARSGLASAYSQRGDLAEAIATLRDLAALRPDYVGAWNNLGNALKDCGQYRDAVTSLERVLALDSQNSIARDNLILATQYHTDDPERNRLYQQEWNQTFCPPLRAQIRRHDNIRAADRRLRIGYVSADFLNHASAFFLDPLLSNHDHARFEICCYAEVRVPDSVTQRLEGYADQWCNTTGLGDEELAEKIRADKIDVLVDLKLHTAGNRLLVFARQPVPVQVSWLGYPGTSGAETIAWRITDPYLDPSPEAGAMDAGAIALPDCFWCYDPLGSEPVVGKLPALKNGFVTFGCLNNFCKVSDRTLELWAGAISAVPNSRLLLLAPPGWPRQRVVDLLGRRGVEAGRIEFITRASRAEYLKQYNRIDIGLDTLPYNGHTTSLDAFWMGVPVITRVGTTPVGRGGWSQLNNLDLAELAAKTDADFALIAARLAGDLPRLSRLRAELRERLRASPLCDGAKFARNMENAFRQIWQKWCAEK